MDAPIDRVVLTIGDIILNDYNHSVTKAGEPVYLTPREYELLKFLGMNAGMVFSKQEIFSKVWGWEFFGGDGTLRYHVSELRRKLGPDVIESYRKYGYRVPSLNVL